MKAVSLVALLLVASASTTASALDLHNTAATIQQDVTKAGNSIKKAEEKYLPKNEADKIQAKTAQLEGKVQEKIQEEKPAVQMTARTALSLAQKQQITPNNNKNSNKTIGDHANIPHFSAKDLAFINHVKQFVSNVEKATYEEKQKNKKTKGNAEGKTTSSSISHDDQSENDHQKGGHHSKICTECNQLAPVAVGVAGDTHSNCDNFNQIIGSTICDQYLDTPFLHVFHGACKSIVNEACHFLKDNHEYFNNNDPCDFILCGTDPFGLL